MIVAALLAAAMLLAPLGYVRHLAQPSLSRRLALAVERNDMAGIEAALEAGAAWPGVVRDGTPALGVASARAARLLAGRFPAAVSDVDGWMETPLHRAAARGDEAALNALAEAGARVEGALDTRRMNGETALHVAAAHGHTECVLVLLDAGADADARSWLGMTPLHYAASAGHLDTVRALLVGGANTRAEAATGMTPAEAAMAGGHRELVVLLQSLESQRTKYAETEAGHSKDEL